MSFEKWPPEIHESLDQIKRRISAKKIKETTVSINKETCTAIIQGSGSEPYQTSLTSCSCFDYESRGFPCKHIYYLAISLGCFPDFPALNRQKAKDFNDNIPNEIAHFQQAFESGAISADKFVKIVTAIQNGK